MKLKRIRTFWFKRGKYATENGPLTSDENVEFSVGDKWIYQVFYDNGKPVLNRDGSYRIIITPAKKKNRTTVRRQKVQNNQDDDLLGLTAIPKGQNGVKVVPTEMAKMEGSDIFGIHF